MAKKSSIKVRLVPEEKPNSAFNYYVKKPTAGDKAKDKLKMKNTIHQHENTSGLLKKNYPHTANS